MCCGNLVGKLEKILVAKAVGNLLRSVGQDPQLSRVLLHVRFILCPLLRNRFGSDPAGGDVSQQPCSSQQADAALGFSQTEVTEINDTDRLKILRQIRSDARKKDDLYMWSREGRPNPVSSSGSDDGGYMFTDEMLGINPLRRYLLPNPKTLWKIGKVSFSWLIGGMHQWFLGAYMN